MPLMLKNAERATANDGLFGPTSVTWRVNREAVLLLGGGRALLMQIAHPLVAAGVADHSDFRSDPLGRLRRTLEAMLTITFGTVEEAKRTLRSVNGIHAKVCGTLEEATGGFAAGSRYQARDPRLLLWVHATLVDTSIVVYRRYVGDLSDEEWEIVKTHPEMGEKILAPIERLAEVRTIIRHCHEHYDGSGYPDSKCREDIPIESRIILVVDAFHAMVSDRPYRKGMSRKRACEILEAEAGRQFDPHVVRVFLDLIAANPKLSVA